MEASNFAAALQQKIKADITVRETQLRGGNMADLAAYKDVCGQIRGLEYALEHIQSLLQSQERNDNE